MKHKLLLISRMRRRWRHRILLSGALFFCTWAWAQDGTPPGYHDAAAAYEAHARGDYAEAARLAGQAVQASPGNLPWRMLWVNSIAQSGDLPAARQRFTELPATLPPDYLLEGAYTAQRLGYKTRASEWFRQSLDAADRGDLAMPADTRYNVRQTVTDLDRRFGFTGALAYGQVGVMNPDYLQTGASRETMQTSAEFWWRPAGLNQDYGKYLDFYARANETLYDGTRGAIGSKTIQTVLGMRVKPFAQHNAVFAVERLLYTQGYSRNDWLLRAAWSAGEGTGVRFDRPDWRYWHLYAEADYYLKRPQMLGVIEGRYGRRYRVPAVDDQFTIAPFIGAAATFDSKVHKRAALGVGPGINIRTAFREDRYHAPQSGVDFTLQYRVRVAGDERGRGLFGTLVFFW